jgi:DNA (cytosine-5)-methyltransferase 1
MLCIGVNYLSRLAHNDKVVVADAHQYLLDHYKEYDFIWSSPPCPTHSRARYWAFGINGKKPVYPNMKLYEEVIFLDYPIH